MSQRRFDVIMTLLLRRMSTDKGFLYSSLLPMLSLLPSILWIKCENYGVGWLAIFARNENDIKSMNSYE